MATHWLNDYASLREQFYKLPGHNAISVVRFLASHCDDAETRQCILNTYDGFRQSITVLERLFGGPGPKSLSAVNFMTNCFTHTLAQVSLVVINQT